MEAEVRLSIQHHDALGFLGIYNAGFSASHDILVICGNREDNSVSKSDHLILP
jgi:hypothetical protein